MQRQLTDKNSPANKIPEILSEIDQGFAQVAESHADQPEALARLKANLDKIKDAFKVMLESYMRNLKKTYGNPDAPPTPRI